MSGYFVGKSMWEEGSDKEYSCLVCNKITWFKPFEKKRMEEDYGYTGIVCSEECREKNHARDARKLMNNNEGE